MSEPRPGRPVTEHLEAVLVLVVRSHGGVHEYVGIEVYSVSDPTSPVRIGGCDTQDQAIGLCAETDYLYVADHHGVAIIDIGDPMNPVVAGWVSVPGWVVDVLVVGTTQYVAAEDLLQMDNTDPGNPIAIQTIPIGGATKIDRAGHFLYVACGDTGLAVIDIADPLAPQLVGVLNTGTTMLDVAADPSSARLYLFTANHSGGLLNLLAQCDQTSSVDGEDIRQSAMTVQAQPSPARGATLIRFAMPSDDPVDVEICDVSGRLVRKPMANTRGGRTGEVSWDGTGAGARRCAAGVYLIRVSGSAGQATGWVMLLD